MAAGGTSSRPPLRLIERALVLTVCLAGLAAQGAPSGECRAEAAGRTVAVHATLIALLAPELLRLVSLGLEGRVHVEVELLRRRPLFFSRRVARHSLDLTVSRDPSGDGFLLDGERPLADPTLLALPRLALPLEDLASPERHEVRISVQLRVITATSLGKVASAKVSRQLHAQASTSSRTRCKRMEDGSFSGWSK